MIIADIGIVPVAVLYEILPGPAPFGQRMGS
jgi:hypothetical protein